MAEPQTLADKVRENSLRRAAHRQRLVLQKSRRRDPLAPDFDRWRVLDSRGRVVSPVAPDGNEHVLTTDEVQRWLAASPEARKHWRAGGAS